MRAASPRWRCARVRGLVAAALLAFPTLAACACGGGESPDDARVPLGEPAERLAWPAGVAARVDSGNAAIRSGQPERARRHYVEATRLGPDVGAAWFGLYMAERALGNEAAADSALARAGAMAPAARVHHEPARDSVGT